MLTHFKQHVETQGACLHVEEGFSGVGAQDGEVVGSSRLLQRQKRHVAPKHRVTAAHETGPVHTIAKLFSRPPFLFDDAEYARMTLPGALLCMRV